MDNKRAAQPLQIGRYALFGEIAAGGMATVHLGRRLGPGGYSRVVAMKRMHPMFAKDPELVAAFLDEARITARVVHPHVVSSTDVIAEEGELLMVMDYIEGESLAHLTRAAFAAGSPSPIPIVVAILAHALRGLHAAHEAKDEAGRPLGVVHRDVSPQNILVGVDGLARVVDFGVAKLTARARQTQAGVVKGKVPYLAPEQLRSEPVDRRVDVHAASAVLWEALVGRRLFAAASEHAAFEQILSACPRPLPSSARPEVPRALDDVFERGAALAPEDRFTTALEMARALEAAVAPAPAEAVGDWVTRIAGAAIAARSLLVADAERSPRCEAPEDPTPPLETPAELTAPRSAESRAVPTSHPPRAPLDETRPLPCAVTPAAARTPPPPVRAPDGGAIGRRHRSGRGGAVAAVVVLVVVLVAVVFIARDRSSTSSPSAAEPSPGPTHSDGEPRTLPSPDARPSAPAASAIAAVSPTANAAPVTSAVTPTGPRPARCSPPYFYEGGFKRYKPGCL